MTTSLSFKIKLTKSDHKQFLLFNGIFKKCANFCEPKKIHFANQALEISQINLKINLLSHRDIVKK